MSQVQSWQIQCRRCGWANSGAEVKCMKCGFALPYRPGMLVAGQSAGAAARLVPTVKIAQPAGFMVRLVAFIIDWMILGVIWLAVWFLWANTLAPTHFDPKAPAAQLLADRSQQVIYLFVALYLIRRLYFQGSWTILGGSPGMRVLNVQIVDKEGQPVGFRRAWLRYLVLYGLLALPNLIISPFMVAFSERKTGLHDVIAGTYVIHFLDADRVQKQAAGLPAALAPAGAAAAAAMAATAEAPPSEAAPGANPSPIPGVTVPAATSPEAQAPATAAPAVAATPSGASSGAVAMDAALAGSVAQAAATRAPVPPPQFPGSPTPVPQPQFPEPPAAPAPPVAPLVPPATPSPVEASLPPTLAAPSPPQSAPDPGPVAPTAPGREIYSPRPGVVPAPVDPYPMPFAPDTPDLPPPAPRPARPAEDPPPA